MTRGDLLDVALVLTAAALGLPAQVPITRRQARRPFPERTLRRVRLALRRRQTVQRRLQMPLSRPQRDALVEERRVLLAETERVLEIG